METTKVFVLKNKTFVITTNPYMLMVIETKDGKSSKRTYNHPDEIKGLDKTDFILARAISNSKSR